MRYSTEIYIPGLKDFIRAKMVEDGRSMEAVLKEAGISKAHWYRIESEKNAMNADILARLSKALKIDLGERLTGDLHRFDSHTKRD